MLSETKLANIGPMLTYPGFDPVALELGPLVLRWYGLMYVFAFASAWLLGRRRARQPWSPLRPEHMDDLVFYVALGILIGGRVGYLLFYGWQQLAADPLSALRVWEGGMSFHGGFVGALLGMWLFARRYDKPLLAVSDFVAPLVPLGLGAGRLGNFINGELWGGPTGAAWGVVFPPLGPQPRHPAMLYELLLEGIALFVILWWFSARPRPRAAVTGAGVLGYGLFRFLVEFVRLPDAHIGYLAWDWLTMGQVLSLPMIMGGLALLAWVYRGPEQMKLAAGA